LTLRPPRKDLLPNPHFCAAQTLGVTVQLTKMVLFAQLAAALSTDSGSKPLGQVIPLLVLTLAYWAYLRIFVPLASFVDMFGEVRLVGWLCCAALWCCGVAVCLECCGLCTAIIESHASVA